MPIIPNKEVYDHSKSDLPKLEKSLDAIIKKEQIWIKTNKALSASLQAVKKSNDGTEARKLAEGTEKLTKSTKELTEIQKQELKIQKQIITSEAKLVASYEAEAQQLAEVRLEQQQRNKQLKQAAQANKVAASSLKGMRVELSKLTDKYDKLSKKERENIKVGGQLQSQINKTAKALKAAENATDRNQRSVGKYSDALKGLGRQLIGALGITAGLTLLVDQFKKAAERMGILNKLTRQLKGTFDITTKEAKRLASQINAIAQNFEDADPKNLQIALTAIVKTFKDISEQEALDLIQEGFQKGSNNSGEFLDILKEYPGFFEKAGLTASEMFAIINQQVKEGVYSDKGVDSIKEATIQLTENTKIVKDALKPLGESVNLQIRQKVEAGKAFEAMQLITKEMLKLGTNSAETQTIIADVFKGAGEDSEAFVKNLHNVELSLEDVKKQTSVVSEANLELSKSYNNFLQSVSDGAGTISEGIAGLTNMGTEFLETARIFNETNLSNKLKIIANAALSLMETAFVPFISVLKALGVEIPEFRFEIENTSETLKKLKLEQSEVIEKSDILVRLTKEQKDALAEETKEVIKLTAAQKKLIEQRQEDQRAINERREDLVEAIENEIELVKSIGEIKAETEQETQDNLNSIIQDGSDRRKQINDEELEQFQKNALIIQEAATRAGQEIGDLMAQGQLTFKEFGKILLKTTLDLVQKQVTIWLVALLPRLLVSLGPVGGLIAFGTLTAVVNSALQAAKTAVSSFAEGGEVHGPGTGTSDSINAKLSDGEFVVKSAAYSDSHDIINAVNDGIVTDKNINDYTDKHNDNTLVAGLLMQNNDTAKQLLQAMLNMGYVVPGNGQATHYKADGSSPKTFPLK